MKLHKDWKPLIERAQAQGWELGMTKRNPHPFLYKDGQKIWLPSTPSDPRSIKNFRAFCKRQGLEL